MPSGTRSGSSPNVVVIGLEEQAHAGGAFEIAADLDELPAFAVGHGGVGDALELVDGFHHLLEEGGRTFAGFSVGLDLHGAFYFGARDLDVERVEFLPLFGGDLLAHLAGIFTRRDDAGDDRGFVGGVEGEVAGELVGVAVPLEALGIAEGVEHAQPAMIGAGGALIEHEVEVDIQQARRVFGALEIAAHPVQ